MARFILKEDVTHKLVGQAILALSAVQHQIREAQSNQEISKLNNLQKGFNFVTKKVEELYFDLEKMKTDLNDGVEEGADEEISKIDVVYQADGDHTEGCYSINVLLPDISDKFIDFDTFFKNLGMEESEEAKQLKIALNLSDDTDSLHPTSKYDFSGFAEESIGHIVIFGCGR